MTYNGHKSIPGTYRISLASWSKYSVVSAHLEDLSPHRGAIFCDFWISGDLGSQKTPGQKNEKIQKIILRLKGF